MRRSLGYLADIRAFAGDRRIGQAACLVFGAAVLEGSGLAALVPLLASFGGRANDAGGPIWRVLPGLGPGVLLAAFVALVAARAFLVERRDSELLRLRLEFIEHLRTRMLNALAMSRWTFLGRITHAGMLNAMITDLARVSQGGYLLAQSLSALAMACAGLLVALLLLPWLACLLIAACICAVLAWGPNLGRAAEAGARMSDRQRRFLHATSDFLRGMKLIKAFGAGWGAALRIEEQAALMAESQLDFARRNARARVIFDVGAAAAAAGVLFVALEVLHRPLSEVLVFALVFVRVVPVMRMLIGNLRLLAHILPAYTAIERLRRRAQAAAELVDPALQAMSLRCAMEFQAVGFAYEPGRPVLQGINLVLPAFQTTALVGPSGAGKTTLADLALGLLQPGQGTILIDGEPLSRENLGCWRNCIGYVPQDVYLFPESIRANLLRFSPKADELDLWEALDRSTAADFVRALPQGLDTDLGEYTKSLSGGERQRIALARALLRKPSFLVLDEATSQLDAESERQIQAAMANLKGQMTVLVIAHRLSTIKAADNILLVESGRIGQSGSWGQLADQPGAFKNLLDAARV
jgi:ATP-binding cassette subfamily C protein